MIDPLAPGAKRFPVPAHLSAGPNNRAYIVQFVVPPFDVLRSQVEGAGGTIYASLQASVVYEVFRVSTRRATRSVLSSCLAY